MSDIMEWLRYIWRGNFTLPTRNTSDSGEHTWADFAFGWFSSIIGVVPGALAAAYGIGYLHITDERLQDLIAVAGAVLSMLVIQSTTGAMISGLDFVFDHLSLPERWSVTSVVRFILAALATILALFLFTSGAVIFPFAADGFAIYWYVTYVSPSLDVAVRGASGALVLKVLSILINVLVIPGIKSILVGTALKPFWRWLHRSDDSKTTGE